MLYLISGASRSGKTLVANRILKERGITYLSLDWLVMGFTNGMPNVGIHDKLFPDEIADKLWSFLSAMCDSILWTESELVIEGEAIRPKDARSLLDKYPDKVRACFLGYAEISVEEKVRQTKAFHTGGIDWLMKEPEERIHEHIKNMVNYSKKIQLECGEHKVKYFDTAADFEPSLELATQYLLALSRKMSEGPDERVAGG